MTKTLFLFVLIFGTSGSLWAHGDLHMRIQKVTKEIESHPDSAYLYFKRGLLFYHHEDFDEALDDYFQSEKLGYQDLALSLSIAFAYLKKTDAEAALVYVHKAMQIDKNNEKVHRLKGQVLMKLGRYEEAANAYEKAIRLAAVKLPEMYLEASEAWQQMDNSSANCKPVDILLEGLQELGAVSSFYNRLIDIAAAHQNYADVLYYQGLIIEQSKRKENPLYQRALTHFNMGNYKAATTDLLAARQALQTLNAYRKKAQATVALSTEIEKLLTVISAKN